MRRQIPMIYSPRLADIFSRLHAVLCKIHRISRTIDQGVSFYYVGGIPRVPGSCQKGVVEVFGGPADATNRFIFPGMVQSLAPFIIFRLGIPHCLFSFHGCQGSHLH